MAIRNVRTDEDPILRKKSREVTKFDDKLKELSDDMFETLYDSEGVGLAAVQVGLLRRIIVIDDRDGTVETLINPVLSCKEGVEVGVEGCLSVPGMVGKVERATSLTVKYQDLEGKEKELQAEGFLARILQHETDHLNGILYTDLTTEVFEVKESEDEEEREEDVE